MDITPTTHKHPSGFILTIAVIIVGSIVSILVVATALVSVTNMEEATVLSEGMEARYAMESCIDEALLQLARDSAYTGGTYSIGALDCDTSISESSGEYTISVDATYGNLYYRSFTVVATLEPTTIVSWN